VHFAGPDDSAYVAVGLVTSAKVGDAIEASRGSYRVAGRGTEPAGRPELEDCILQPEAPVTKLTAGY
jgi:hypothetical protein